MQSDGQERGGSPSRGSGGRAPCKLRFKIRLLLINFYAISHTESNVGYYLAKLTANYWLKIKYLKSGADNIK